MSADTTSSSNSFRLGSRHVPRLKASGNVLLTGLRLGRWADWGMIAAILLSLVMVRTSLAPWQSQDYLQFLVHWFEFLQLHGFHGLGLEFANYNMPYLYLLWVGTLITPDALVAVKTIGAASDLALALGCVALFRQLHVQRQIALVGGAAVLLLPEVLLNAAAWGQADSTYTAFLIWALVAALRDHSRVAWVLYAIAFTFKLQAAFVLPAFVVLQVTRRWTWQGPLLGIAAVLLTEVPALIAGRSPAALVAIYFDQANQAASLTMNAPSIYALLPEWAHELLRPAGMYFALACMALLSFVVLQAARRSALTPSTVVLLVATLATLAPYTLPMMHERYFYVGNVLLFVHALRHRRLMPWALVAQAVAVLAYSAFLFGAGPVLPMGELTLIQGAVLVVLIRQVLRDSGAAALVEEIPTRPSQRAAEGTGAWRTNGSADSPSSQPIAREPTSTMGA